VERVKSVDCRQLKRLLVRERLFSCSKFKSDISEWYKYVEKNHVDYFLFAKARDYYERFKRY